MFDNIGGKLKKLAQVECWIGIGIFGLIGLVEMFSSFFGGLFTIAMGVLLSWVSSLLTYGVGVAVEVAQENNSLLKQMQKDIRHIGVENAAFHESGSSTSVTGTNGWRCKQCGTQNSSIALICRECGRGQ